MIPSLFFEVLIMIIISDMKKKIRYVVSFRLVVHVPRVRHCIEHCMYGIC